MTDPDERPSGNGRGSRVVSLRLSLASLPLATPISDAKVFTGRQRPLTSVAMLFAEVRTADGGEGVGFSYSKRAGGPALFAHAKEIAPQLIGQDARDIGRIWEHLFWAGASVGRGGLAVQAIAAIDIALWDLKAKTAGMPLARLLGAYRDGVPCYNTSGGFLSSTIDEVVANARASLGAGIGGIKIKVGHPDNRVDLERVRAVREAIGPDAKLMVDANQQWSRPTALRIGRALEEFDLTWIEEPLDAQDAEGHAALAAALDTPIATGEMLSSVVEHERLVRTHAVDIIQPDAARVGGITQFLKILALAEQDRLTVAPHFAMELHVHLAAAYPFDVWVEHFDWLEPLFDERLEVKNGLMMISERPGLGVTLSSYARSLTLDEVEVSEGDAA